MNIDLFAGIGGWSHDAIGFEIDRDACATRVAVGLPTIRADIAAWPLEQLVGKVAGISASPPCQTFSTAGKGDGIEHVDQLCALARRYDPAAHERIDGRTELVLEPLRWTLALRPEWLACEQVPAVLPIWHATADTLTEHGYSTWHGVLNAADYGVPQTRKRAILIASRTRTVAPPAPTHARVPQPSLFGTLRPWVSMADALGWGMTERPGVTLAPGTENGGPDVSGCGGPDVSGCGGSGARAALRRERERGAWTVRTGANTQTVDGLARYERACDEPAPTLDTKAGHAWRLNRRQTDFELDAAAVPAPTVVGSALGKGVWTVNDGDVKLTVRDALILQSFDPDLPVQGTRTAQFRQVGNAIPPGLARHIIGAAA